MSEGHPIALLPVPYGVVTLRVAMAAGDGSVRFGSEDVVAFAAIDGQEEVVPLIIQGPEIVPWMHSSRYRRGAIGILSRAPSLSPWTADDYDAIYVQAVDEGWPVDELAELEGLQAEATR